MKLPSPYYEISDEVVHPSIVELSPGINTQKYCIAYTPYPKSDYHFENPCVVFTNDFVSLDHSERNPVINEPPYGYNSDPELYVEDGKIYLLYRFRCSLGNVIKLYKHCQDTGWEFHRELIKGEFKVQDFGSPSLIHHNQKYYFFSHNLDSSDWTLELRIANTFEGIEQSIPIKINYDASIGKFWHSTFRVFNRNIYGLVQTASHPGGVGLLKFVKLDPVKFNLDVINVSHSSNYYRPGMCFDELNLTCHIIFSTYTSKWQVDYKQYLLDLDNIELPMV